MTYLMVLCTLLSVLLELYMYKDSPFFFGRVVYVFDVLDWMENMDEAFWSTTCASHIDGCLLVGIRRPRFFFIICFDLLFDCQAG